jgi:hypothetical protein
VGGSNSAVGIASRLRAGRSVARTPVEARYFDRPKVHQAFCKIGTGYFLRVNRLRVALTIHPLLGSRLLMRSFTSSRYVMGRTLPSSQL